MVTWKTLDSKGGCIFLESLIPSEKNLFTDEIPQWSIGTATRKNRYRKIDYIFDTDKSFKIEEKARETFDLTNDFCQEYFDAFSESLY